MNYLFVFLLVSISFSVFCEEKGVIEPYKIESENYDESIPKGKFKISGIVYYGFGKNKEILVGAKISTSTFNGTMSDFDGKFSLLISDTAKIVEVSYVGIGKLSLDFSKFRNGKHYLLSIFCYEVQDFSLKPVIYAYSEKEIEASIELNYAGNLTFTYPEINDNKWNFKTKKDGTISFENGKNYPYLFYEGLLSEKLHFKQKNGKYFGNIVQQDSLIPFLETTLINLGLNEKEQADFITFWGPKMTVFENVFVQILIDEDYDQIAILKINPKPDNIRRIYLIYSEIKDKKSFFYETQNFYTFNRNGFTVLEWGGSELNKLDL